MMVSLKEYHRIRIIVEVRGTKKVAQKLMKEIIEFLHAKHNVDIRETGVSTHVQ